MSSTPSSVDSVPSEPLSRVFRQVEADLSGLRYRDMPIGPTLNDYLVGLLLWGVVDGRRSARWLNRARMVKHFLRPSGTRPRSADIPNGQILVTWQEGTARFDELLHPVVEALGTHDVLVLVGSPDWPRGLPTDTPALAWHDQLRLNPGQWRREFRRHAPEWHERLEDVCRRYRLPSGTFELLALRLLVASQWIEGSLGLLAAVQPAAVVTEYDRSYQWSCLVTAARHLGIPTLTLVHGVIPPDAVGFSPLIADIVACWGTADRNRLVAAGVDIERIVVTGCPRLTRDLPVDPAVARSRFALVDQPTALLATSPDRGALELAATFCEALDRMPGVTGVVRLHPAESMDDYVVVRKRHPGVLFMPSTAGTLDESLAAASVVVVRGSGVGGDALLKRRPVVVLSPDGELRGNDADLVKRAGCSWASSADELRQALQPYLTDARHAPEISDEAEAYLADFCAAFGTDSSQRIAEVVRGMARHRIAGET